MLLGAEPVDRDELIRAMFAELLSLPAAEVRDAIGIAGPAMAAANGATPDEQLLADKMATGLAHLGWIIRLHPRLAPALQYDLAGLLPALVLTTDELDAIASTAARVGAHVGPARYGGQNLDTTTTVVELAADAVRLVLTAVRAPVAAAG